MRGISSLLEFFQLMIYVIYSTAQLNDTQQNSTRGFFTKAAVAADNGICSDIGKDILKRRGTAVEAVIATTICTGVINPHSCGLGGGHFLTVYDKSAKSCTVFDARERAPFEINESVYNNASEAQIGWKAIAVPGELHGFWTAYKAFGGNTPWKDLWTPTIELCRNGIKVSAPLATQLKENARYLENNTDFDIFKNPETGKFFKHGEFMKRHTLADIMEKISNAEDPVKLFYDSSLTTSFVDEIRLNGGIINLEDMKNYSTRTGAVDRPPIYAELQNDLTVCGPPPPSSASLVASMINIMDGYNIDPNSMANSSILEYHRMVEAMKFAYGNRFYLGDMDYLPSVKYLAQSVARTSYGNFIREMINDKECVDDSFYYGQATLTWDSGTAQVSVIDEYGNAASLTSSINT